MPNVVLPDGRVVAATDDQAEAATTQQGGATVETPDSANQRLTDQSDEDYFSTPGQKLAALGEGAASGISFGLSDSLLDSYSTEQRAARHPWIRGIGEAAGMLAPAIATGGATLGGEIGEAAAGGLGLSGVASKLASRGIEGGLYGLGGAVSHASLSTDPLTVDSVLSSIGVGAVLNIGAGVLGDSFIKGGEAAQAKLAEANIAETRGAALDQSMSEFKDIKSDMAALRRSVVKDTKDTLEALGDTHAKAAAELDAKTQAFTDAMDPELRKTAIKNAADAYWSRSDELARGTMSPDITGKFDTSDSPLDTDLTHETLPGKPPAEQGNAFDRNINNQNRDKVYGLLDKGDLDGASAHTDQMGDRLRNLAGAHEHGAEYLARMPDGNAYHLPESSAVDAHLSNVEATRSAQEVQISQVTSEAQAKLDSLRLPSTLKDMRGMDPGRLQVMEDTLGKSPAGQALLGRFQKIASDLGITTDTGVLSGIKSQISDVASLGRKAESKGNGLGTLLRHGLKHTVPGGYLIGAAVSDAKAAVMQRITGIVARIGVPVGKAVIGSGAIIARVASDYHTTNKNPRDMAGQITSQIAARATSAPDTSYMVASRFLEAGQAPMASAIQQTLIAHANYLAAKMPKDPGTAMSMTHSQYKPSEAQSRDLIDMAFAAEHPLDAAESLMVDGRPSMIVANTLWDLHPGVMQALQQEAQMAMPRIQQLPYSRRSALGAAIRMPLDSLNEAQNFASLQMQAFGQMSGGSPTPAAASTSPSKSNAPSATLTQTQQLQNR